MLEAPRRIHRRPPSPAWARKLLFAALYFSEGAPIGFIWFAIPVRLRAAGVPVQDVTWLASILVLPWVLKFLWAPLVDAFRGERWTLRDWIYTSQSLMAISLLPLLWFRNPDDLGWLAAALLVHGFAAATQDVAIDALCMASTTPAERGAYNSWMQVGVLLGRAALGGGVVAVYERLGHVGAVSLLIATILVSMAMLTVTRLPESAPREIRAPLASLVSTYRRVLAERLTWWGLAFALLAGAAFKSFEAVYGLYLVDRGFSQETIGAFTAGPMIGALVVGSMLGGWLADRVGVFRFVPWALAALSAVIAALAWSDIVLTSVPGALLFSLLASIGVGIGVFTSASYAMYMNLTQPAIAASQFSAYMGAINGCESWSVFVLGRLIASRGYGFGFLIMCATSLAALPILRPMAREAATPG